jgi:HK97 gp10 family phage protein
MLSLSIVKNDFAKLAGGMAPRTRHVVETTVNAIETDAKRRVPVRTGALRDSIHGRMLADDEGVVEVGADYGGYVEYGTVHMAARPYLTPAAEAQRGPFAAAMAHVVEG